jgi:hypothetical protein
VAVPRVVVPSRKLTDPVGALDPCGNGFTIAVKGSCPFSESGVHKVFGIG